MRPIWKEETFWEFVFLCYAALAALIVAAESWVEWHQWLTRIVVTPIAVGAVWLAHRHGTDVLDGIIAARAHERSASERPGSPSVGSTDREPRLPRATGQSPS